MTIMPPDALTIALRSSSTIGLSKYTGTNRNPSLLPHPKRTMAHRMRPVDKTKKWWILLNWRSGRPKPKRHSKRDRERHERQMHDMKKCRESSRNMRSRRGRCEKSLRRNRKRAREVMG